jgi:superfamily II DNA or RNA helicase/HKD family nuclease
MLKQGLYETVLTESLNNELEQVDYHHELILIDKAEAAKIMAKHLAESIEKKLNEIGEHDGVQEQINFTNKMMQILDGDPVLKPGQQLLGLIEKENSIYAIDQKAKLTRPETSLSMSSLFTGAIHEPQLYTELKKEIIGSDTIYLLVSFIKWSGLRLIINELQSFTNRGGKLKIVTTSYMGATDIKSIEALEELPNSEIKISYDTKRTRLHAKTYVFIRETGFSTAYVGSSNLSHAAMSTGLEWNVKVTAKDLPETIEKIIATFDSYWNSLDFQTYRKNDRPFLETALRSEKKGGEDKLFLVDIQPYPYQQEILDQLEAERRIRGHFRNLVVAATGTGKTVISAFDYKQFCKKNTKKSQRLLFIAHREEILLQSIQCFRTVLRNENFGDLFVGNYRPTQIDHLFMSIQTFNAQDFCTKTKPDFYDYIIVDEFHHAAAQTYQRLLDYYQPQIILGLTATPERMDGRDILRYFDHRVASEIRLPEAINRKLLSPFQYFGVTDSIDLDSVRWRRGGYDQQELSNLYTMDQLAAKRRGELIIESLNKYVSDLEEVRGIAFCVSQDHVKFMAKFFNEKGISSMPLTSQSSVDERKMAKIKLLNGEIKIIFVVDLYNEGVDIPEINTVLFLRPTQSLTVFIQQLGRGLRLSENKDCLTVLDFIGQANTHYNFDEKFNALLSNTTKSLKSEIENGFANVPKGCYIQLEKKAKESILKNIAKSFDNKKGLVLKIATFTEDSGLSLNLENFINYYHLDINRIYKTGNFSRLCVLAGLKNDFDEPLEETMDKAFQRICNLDSRRLIIFLLKALPNLQKHNFLDSEERMLRLFFDTIYQKSYQECGFANMIDGLVQIQKAGVLFDELMELLKICLENIDFVDEPLTLDFDCPLDLYCSYSRDQILVGLDYENPRNIREGVKYFPDKKLDVLFITLNKSDKDYSPTTMYKDYSVNDRLFHWQSQSTTSESSPTGLRYQHNRENGSKVLIFVREFKKGLSVAAPYSCLGLADYVSHEGSKPMNILWCLHKPIPARFLKKTNKLIVG